MPTAPKGTVPRRSGGSELVTWLNFMISVSGSVVYLRIEAPLGLSCHTQFENMAELRSVSYKTGNLGASLWAPLQTRQGIGPARRDPSRLCKTISLETQWCCARVMGSGTSGCSTFSPTAICNQNHSQDQEWVCNSGCRMRLPVHRGR